MNDRKSKIALILATAALAIALGCACFTVLGMLRKPAQAPEAQAASAEEGDIQYVLYLGTNDKDTNEPVFAPEEAKSKLKEILISRMGGYTIQEANGGWIDDDGTDYQEYTLVIYLSDTSEADVHALCDVLIDTYKQSSVLIQMNKTKTEFYSK
jgi:hypothetical protein